MSYAYAGPISSVINGLAALLAAASSFLSPISHIRIVAGPSFISRLASEKRIRAYFKMYGSLNIDLQNFRSLEVSIQRTLVPFMERGLVNLVSLDTETERLSMALRSILGDEEARVLALALQRDGTAFVETGEAVSVANRMNVSALTYDQFLVEAYRRGIVEASVVMES